MITAALGLCTLFGVLLVIDGKLSEIQLDIVDEQRSKHTEDYMNEKGITELTWDEYFMLSKEEEELYPWPKSPIFRV